MCPSPCNSSCINILNFHKPKSPEPSKFSISNLVRTESILRLQITNHQQLKRELQEILIKNTISWSRCRSNLVPFTDNLALIPLLEVLTRFVYDLPLINAWFNRLAWFRLALRSGDYENLKDQRNEESTHTNCLSSVHRTSSMWRSRYTHRI